MLLDIYFGEQLANASKGTTTLLKTITGSVLFYFLMIFLFFYLLYLIFFFIRPLLKKDPKKYYKRYKEVRQEMQKIDNLYENKKIDFEDYVFAQFNFAKEYENIISFLATYPEYRNKVKSYKIAYHEKIDKQRKKQNPKKMKFWDKINFLVGLLLPQTKYYTIEEVIQSILDEGFDSKVAKQVVVNLRKEGAKFATNIVNKDQPTKFANFFNKLFNADTTQTPKAKEATSIDIKEAIEASKEKETKKDFIESDFEKHSYVDRVKKEDKEEKKSFLSLFKGKKSKVDEIKDIFDEIDSSLKGK